VEKGAIGMDRKGVVQLQDKVKQLNKEYGLSLEVTLPYSQGPTKIVSSDKKLPEVEFVGTPTEICYRLDDFILGLTYGLELCKSMGGPA